MNIYDDYFQITGNSLVETAFVLAWETEYKDLLMVKQILALPQLKTRMEFASKQNKLKHEVLEKLSTFIRSSDPKASAGAIALALCKIEVLLKEVVEIGFLTVGYTATELEIAASLRTQAAQKLLPLLDPQPQQEVAKPNSKSKSTARNTTRKKKTP